MLTPRNIFIILLLLLLTGAGVLLLQPKFANNNSNSARTTTVLFVDITQSDTGLAWMQQPYRNQFIKALNSSFTSGQNVVAAFVLHGRTRDAQPFWTNYPLSLPPGETLADSAATAAANLQQLACLEAFDSLATSLILKTGNATDSALTSTTDILGALQQAAVYFKGTANRPGDRKQVYFLCDARENAGIGNPIVKTERIPSKKDAEKWGAAALQQLHSETDVGNTLEGADIYFLTPNSRLYHNEGRNLRRIFWEFFFKEQLKCRNLKFL